MSLEKNDLEIRYNQLMKERERIDKDIERIIAILYTLDSYDVVKKEDRD